MLSIIVTILICCLDPQSASYHVCTSMSLIRGKAFEALGNRQHAIDSFQRALRLDVMCYDAFECLVSHHMLSAEKGHRNISLLSPRLPLFSVEKQLMSALPFDKQCGDSSDLVKSILNSKLKKV